MEVTLCKLPKGDTNSFFRVQTEWYTDSMIRLTILDDETVWAGKVSVAEITNLCQHLSSSLSTMTVENWLKETKRALASHGGSKDFKYVMANGRFMWMKFDEKFPGITIKFGAANLESVPTFELIECMMDQMIESNSNLHIEVKTLEEGKQKLESENQNLLQMVSRYITEKVEMEQTLYSNFLEILNAKKTRIDDLQKQLDDFHKSGPSAKPDILDDSLDEELEEIQVRCRSKKPVKAATRRAATKPSSVGDDDKRKLKALPKEKPQTRTKSKATTSTHVSVKRKAESTSTCVRELKTSVKKTTHNYFTSETHYDSDTDVDHKTDEEDVDPFGVVTASDKHQGNDDNLFDDERERITNTTLPKRIKDKEPPVVRETVQIVETVETSISTLDAKSKRDAEREQNTQQLLDDLGI